MEKLTKIELAKTVENFLYLEENKPKDKAIIFNEVLMYIHKFCNDIFIAEKEGYSREEILEIVQPIRDIYNRSPFLKRLQEWPRGYCGDFETIEYICDVKNKAKKNSVEYYLEEYALKSLISEQHRCKVRYQAEMVLEVFRQNKKARVMSIGCGGSRDLKRIQKELALMNIEGEFVLIDSDQDAIDFSEKRLNYIKKQCKFVHGNIVRRILKFDESEKFDLILIGGVFDYLSDKTIRFLLDKLYFNFLNVKGKILFTNIKKGNPYRPWIEYFVDWILIERDKTDIMKLCEDINLNKNHVSIKSEKTGLTYLVEIIKE